MTALSYISPDRIEVVCLCILHTPGLIFYRVSYNLLKRKPVRFAVTSALIILELALNTLTL